MKWISKTILFLTLLSLLQAQPYNQRITITAGTPVQVSAAHIKVHSILIQMRTGGTGRGYILRPLPGVTPSASNGADLSAELAPATATAPGGAWSDNDDTPFGTRKDIYLDAIWIDGSNSTDTVTVTYDSFP